ncbi:MAG: SPOR domain-containing protein, partial [Magnetospirillum sp. WYHS-4]
PVADPAPVAAPSAPPPPPAPEPQAAAVAAPAPKPVAEPAKGGAYKVQIGALRTRAEAEAEWKKQQKNNADLLSGFGLTVVEVEVAGKGTFYRIRAGGVSSEAAAKDLCTKLTARKLPCLVVKPGN